MVAFTLHSESVPTHHGLKGEMIEHVLPPNGAFHIQTTVIISVLCFFDEHVVVNMGWVCNISPGRNNWFTRVIVVALQRNGKLIQVQVHRKAVSGHNTWLHIHVSHLQRHLIYGLHNI